jgi:hypothetical protein
MLRLNPPTYAPHTHQHPQAHSPASRLRSGSISFRINPQAVASAPISNQEIEHFLVLFIQKIWSIPSVKELNNTEHQKLKDDIKKLVRYVRNERSQLNGLNETDLESIRIYSSIYNKLFNVYKEIKKNKNIILTDIAGPFIDTCGRIRTTNSSTTTKMP